MKFFELMIEEKYELTKNSKIPFLANKDAFIVLNKIFLQSIFLKTALLD